MKANAERAQDVAIARLAQEGALRVAGADARAFLHAQLTSDIEHLGAARARRAGWCTAKGRLLATLLVVPQADGFLLLLPAALIDGVMKRMRMFVLRSKVTLDDESARWAQYGVLGPGALDALAAQGLPVPSEDLGAAAGETAIVVRVEGDRARILMPAEAASAPLERLALRTIDESRWTLADIRAGVPQVVAATQELFVPQMLNFEAVGGLDFKKGCYPGQEVVARAQYRGQIKRHMRRARVAGDAVPAAGQDLYCDDQPGQACGTVVAACIADDGGSELLAVVPVAASDAAGRVRMAPGGPALEWLPLPYAA
ncbi:MAG: folate-binding protein [Burkholderiales bacterium]|nr:folate-binding protein [Burkholderiales bacterium]